MARSKDEQAEAQGAAESLQKEKAQACSDDRGVGVRPMGDGSEGRQPSQARQVIYMKKKGKRLYDKAGDKVIETGDWVLHGRLSKKRKWY